MLTMRILGSAPQRGAKKAKVAIGVAIACGVFSLTGCGGGAVTETSLPPQTSEDVVTIENCGREVISPTTPARIIIGTGANATTLLSFGIREQIVGVGGFAEPMMPKWEGQISDLPRLADSDMGTREQTLAENPDLVFASNEWYFDESAGRASIQELTESGAAVYMSAQACESGGGSLENLYLDITNLGALLREPDKAEQLVQELRSRVDEARESVAGKSHSATILAPGVSVDAGVYAMGPSYTEGAILTELGQKNVYDDVAESYTKVTVEDIIARNPEVIFLDQDNEDVLADAKETFKTTTAGRNGDIYLLKYSTYAGPGSVSQIDRLEEIAEIFSNI